MSALGTDLNKAIAHLEIRCPEWRRMGYPLDDSYGRAVLAYVADLEGAARLVVDTDGSAGAIAELARSLSQPTKEQG